MHSSFHKAITDCKSHRAVGKKLCLLPEYQRKLRVWAKTETCGQQVPPSRRRRFWANSVNPGVESPTHRSAEPRPPAHRLLSARLSARRPTRAPGTRCAHPPGTAALHLLPPPPSLLSQHSPIFKIFWMSNIPILPHFIFVSTIEPSPGR